MDEFTKRLVARYRREVKAGNVPDVVLNAKWQLEAGDTVTEKELEAYRRHNPNRYRAERLKLLEQWKAEIAEEMRREAEGKG